MTAAKTNRPPRLKGSTKAGAPRWVREALNESSAPNDVLDTLLESRELAPLWDELTEAQRQNVDVLPEYIGFMLIGGKRLPWSEQWTVSEQRAQAKSVARLARELNTKLGRFAPLAPFGMHQVFRQSDNDKHFFLVGLPPIASPQRNQDSLLLRIAKMADSFEASSPQRVKRPTRADAWQIYFVRTFAPLFDDPVGHAFLAGLVNEFSEGGWDAERVRKSLTRSRSTTSR